MTVPRQDGVPGRDRSGACSMQPMVEAARDGRLDPRELASLSRHLTACGACQAASRDLDRLAALAALHALELAKPIDHRRARLALLNRAALPEASSPRRTYTRTVGILAVAASLAIAGVVLAHRAVSMSGDAALSASSASTLPTVALGAQPPPAIPTSVATLDAPAREPTQGIREGAPPAAPEVAADERVRPSAQVAQAPRPRAVAPPSVSALPSRLAGTTQATPTTTASAARVPDAPADAAASAKLFNEGMRLVQRGDYAAGAEKLDAYRRANASDARSEDAAYVTILALQRAGRKEEARKQALLYLSRYPNGYRRATVEPLAR